MTIRSNIVCKYQIKLGKERLPISPLRLHTNCAGKATVTSNTSLSKVVFEQDVFCTKFYYKTLRNYPRNITKLSAQDKYSKEKCSN